MVNIEGDVKVLLSVKWGWCEYGVGVCTLLYFILYYINIIMFDVLLTYDMHIHMHTQIYIQCVTYVLGMCVWFN